ncbi:MAG: hypothetical protein QXE10_05435 [Desulfurococcaceae archaeon]
MFNHSQLREMLERLLSSSTIKDLDVTRHQSLLEKTVVLIPLFFIGEETTLLLRKVIGVLNNALLIKTPTRVILNDCDKETFIYVSNLLNLCKLPLGLSLDDLSIIATYLTLLRKHSLVVKELRNRELSENEYYEYQIAMEKTAHYLRLLSEKINDEAVLSEILSKLDLVEEMQLDERTIEEFKEILGFKLHALSGLFLASSILSKCSTSLMELLLDAWKKFESFEKDKYLYMVIPREISFLIERIIPSDKVVVI